MSGKLSPHSPPPGKANAPSVTRNPTEAANATSLQPPRPNGRPPEDTVRERAYALWEQAGRPESDGVEFWLRAEHELTNPM